MGFRSGLGMGASVGQKFLILLNIIFAVLALALLILGIYVRASDVLHPTIKDLFSRVELGNLNMGDLVVALSGLIIAIAIFTLLTAALGGFGACGKIRVLLIVYIVVLCLIVLLELVALGLLSKLVYGMDNWMKDKFLRALRFYNGIGNNDVYSKGWNFLFLFLDCCAVNPVTALENDFARLPSDWWTSGTRGFDIIPYTCCKEANVKTYFTDSNPACTLRLVDHRPRGCFNVVKEHMTRVAAPTLVFSILIIIAEIVAILAAILIVIHVTRNDRQTGKINGAVYKGSHLDTKPQ